ncbi:MAG TPA: hypothetical protein VGW38_09400, partial [Chloroflexota bacterium]|nr:hypothetical protein [Chloroflexota bacterium]
MVGPLLQRERPGEGAASALALPEEEAPPEARAGERPPGRHIAAPARRLTLRDGTHVEVGIAAAPSTDGTAASGIYVPAYVGPHGALFMVVEGAPFETAAFIHRAVQHALDRDQGTAGARLLRAVREACTRLQAQTLHRYELSSLGFTALLLDGNSAHVTQLPPCQVYVVDGHGLRAVPEEPMRGAAHVGSIDGRRWEVEIDLCRINLRPGATLALCTSTVAVGVGRTQLQA